MLLNELNGLVRAKFDIGEDRKGALRSRFQHLQRLKFPAGVNTGRGKKVDYGWWETLQVCLAFELIDQGLSPDLVIAMISNNLDGIEFGAAVFTMLLEDSSAPAELISRQKMPDGQGCFLYCAANALANFKVESEGFQGFMAFYGEDELVRDNEFRHLLDSSNGTFVNLGNIIMHILNYRATALDEGLDAVVADFLAWASDFRPKDAS